MFHPCVFVAQRLFRRRKNRAAALSAMLANAKPLGSGTVIALIVTAMSLPVPVRPMESGPEGVVQRRGVVGRIQNKSELARNKIAVVILHDQERHRRSERRDIQKREIENRVNSVCLPILPIFHPQLASVRVPRLSQQVPVIDGGLENRTPQAIISHYERMRSNRQDPVPRDLFPGPPASATCRSSEAPPGRLARSAVAYPVPPAM